MFYKKSSFNKTKKNFSTRMHLCQWNCKHRLLFVLQIIRKGNSNTPNEKKELHGLVIYLTKGDVGTQPMFTSLTAQLHVWITSSWPFPKQFYWDVKSGKWYENQQINLVAGKEGRELVYSFLMITFQVYCWLSYRSYVSFYKSKNIHILTWKSYLLPTHQ